LLLLALAWVWLFVAARRLIDSVCAIFFEMNAVTQVAQLGMLVDEDLVFKEGVSSSRLAAPAFVGFIVSLCRHSWWAQDVCA